MSLLTDQDYFLQSLRLAFLRLDAPLAASSTSHLVHSLPSYSLSSHAHHAGLSEDGVPEFGLSRSPGPIPSTSHGTVSSALPGSRNRPDRSAKLLKGDDPLSNNNNNSSRNLARQSSPPSRQTSLKHSETIVGRHGGRSAGGGGAGGVAGMRVQGKKTSWKPKPHQLEAWTQQQQQQSSSTAQDRSAASTLRAGGTGREQPPRFIFDSPNGTPQPSYRRQSSEIAGTVAVREEEDSDEDDAEAERQDVIGEQGHESEAEAAFTSVRRTDGANMLDRYRPALALDNRSLSHALANQQPISPTDSNPGSESQASFPGVGGVDRQMAALDAEPRSIPDFATTTTAASDSMTGSLAGTDEISVEENASLGLAGRLGEDESGDEDEEEEEEEDDFEFSLHGRDATSSFEAVPPGVITANLPNQQAELTALVSPTNGNALANGSKVLPSIAEAAENVGEGTMNDEDAALKAAQSARRRARRRVNISGRIPIPLGIPLSPELDGSGTPAQGRSTPSSPGGGASVARTGGSPSTSSRSSSPAVAMQAGSGPRPITPSSPARPMSPTSPHSLAAALLRSRSGVSIKTRQRSQTDPSVPTVSGSYSPTSPLASPSKERRAIPNGSTTLVPLPQRNRSYTSQSLSASPIATSRPLFTSSQTTPPPSSPISASSTSELVTQPLRIKRAKSAGAADGAAPLPTRTISPRPSLTLTTPSTAGLPDDAERRTAGSTTANIPSPVTPNATAHPRASPSRSPSKITDPYITFPITKSDPVPFIPL